MARRPRLLRADGFHYIHPYMRYLLTRWGGGMHPSMAGNKTKNTLGRMNVTDAHHSSYMNLPNAFMVGVLSLARCIGIIED